MDKRTVFDSLFTVFQFIIRYFHTFNKLIQFFLSVECLDSKVVIYDYFKLIDVNMFLFKMPSYRAMDEIAQVVIVFSMAVEVNYAPQSFECNIDDCTIY